MSVGKLPEGWISSNLGEIVDVNSGIGFPIQYQGKSSGDYPVFKVRDISLAVAKRKGNLNDAGHYISTEEVMELKGKIFRPGTTVFAKIGEAVKLNRRAIVQKPGLVDNNVMAISATVHEMDKFVFHFMNTIDLSQQVRSTTIPSIRKGDIENIYFFLPPLAEQKIIAEKLDTLLAQVDTTKARLEQIPKILKRFRQAVLASALNGKMINESCEKKTATLGSFVSIDIGNAFKSSEFSEVGIPLLRGQNIEPGSLRWDETKRFPLEKLQRFSHLFINEDDIILAMDRPIISSGLKLARAKKNDIPCVLVQRVARFKEFNGLLPDYLYLLLKDLAFINYIQPNQTGSDIPHISGKQILNFNCHIPPLSEQREIVRRVEQLFAYADTIEKQVNNALARVNNLTQSILAKAFRGELTAQWRAENPELISGENSAAALLEKIKAERAASSGKKASRKKS
ncbi:restriction endonuclease subunit S [Pantoea sp. S-LA4]